MSSVRGLLSTLLAIFQTRLELLSVEIQEEKLRLLRVLAWGGLALLLGGMAMLFSAGFIAMLFWDEHRLLALGLLAVFFLLACILSLWRVSAHLRAATTGVLSATLAELEQDWRALASPESRQGENDRP